MLRMPDGFPSCFGEYGVQVADMSMGARMTQNLVTCVYQTKLWGHCRLITVTWCKNLMGQGLSVNVDDPACHYTCKVDMKPWFFWKKQGSKAMEVDGQKVEVFWDLSSAKYLCGPEPQDGFYLAIVSDGEVALLLGDMVREAYKKTQARPPTIEAMLLSRREHVFGKRYYTTKAQFGESGRTHDIMIECHTNGAREPRLYVRVDRQLVIQVKKLMWKFRGNQTILVDGLPVEVFWDVHNWLFNPSLGNAVFMFQTCVSSERPWMKDAMACSSSLRVQPGTGAAAQDAATAASHVSAAGFSLLLYAWKSE
ncbi:uncharacterized protein LOC9642892 [Selaginella moellendorffii]|uniref:uncharacterized protein LOC9642892 n=1 Tax=Selaginella moellendorffii TaxID=88036 RepID=UPI000D1D0F31|nr:uncharacterized protein LOC9642892 [Selaginella moellendorffii]XP_024516492.1 uncharacterized protein LOC9642892 [Selaginella moellendorffii]XP_024516493.1 uncharacterized protein LOC9642892 [Selaginella moellendorffii]XP_024516494.1 uncharacterized protein LOC9642892 [Selaginella moellendorffii]XP_024516495.1 uncharacterized protein LOC9642892 [Selaginella moellendorffii]XP_024516496.1 uncharacterized protein LOC9642892 [Selaginella moellendorffii]XP_024516497.1 uncharacterized protein LO|eukprot:XP_024516491.1 uncharacterized protein LOC9642892 [Selaginella moellendorffii]